MCHRTHALLTRGCDTIQSQHENQRYDRDATNRNILSVRDSCDAGWSGKVYSWMEQRRQRRSSKESINNQLFNRHRTNVIERPTGKIATVPPNSVWISESINNQLRHDDDLTHERERISHKIHHTYLRSRTAMFVFYGMRQIFPCQQAQHTKLERDNLQAGGRQPLTPYPSHIIISYTIRKEPPTYRASTAPQMRQRLPNSAKPNNEQ